MNENDRRKEVLDERHQQLKERMTGAGLSRRAASFYRSKTGVIILVIIIGLILWWLIG